MSTDTEQIPTPEDDFAEVFHPPNLKPEKDITEDEEYQKFVESMVPHCHCTAQHRPCDGVLAGGLCDNIQESRDDVRWDDEEDV